jgi:hypothetical protein
MVHESFGDIALASCAHHSGDSTHGLYLSFRGHRN